MTAASPDMQPGPRRSRPRPRSRSSARQAAEFDAAVLRWGWPRFRAQQVRDWAYGKLVT
jgi:hypothetical protein